MEEMERLYVGPQTQSQQWGKSTLVVTADEVLRFKMVKEMIFSVNPVALSLKLGQKELEREHKTK